MRRPLGNPTGRNVVPIPISTRGLVVHENRGTSDPAGAIVYENIWPKLNYGEVRGGLEELVTLSGEVQSLFEYNVPGAAHFFGATATGIFDITGTVTTAVAGQTSGRYSVQQVGTVGGNFLICANGTDEVQQFDGTTWSASAITGVDTALLSHVCLYRNRLFFVEKDTKDAWFLPVDSIAGAAQRVSLGGVFQQGGALLFASRWSVDAGDGIDDKIAFFSTEGEVAIYEGGDPADVTSWRLIGIYNVSKPMGANATFKAGGDIAIATNGGIYPLSEALSKDPEALSLTAITRNIEPLWIEAARSQTTPWEVVKWADNDLALVTLPDDTSGKMLAVSLETGGWSVITGWAAKCAGIFNGQAYIGRSDGKVLACDKGGMDDGLPFTATWVPSFQQYGQPGTYQRAQQCRGTFLSFGDFSAKFGVSRDYQINLPSPPGTSTGAVPGVNALVWDVGLWDGANWGQDFSDQNLEAKTTMWRSVSGTGYALAPSLQITSGTPQKLQVQIVNMEMALDAGGIIV